MYKKFGLYLLLTLLLFQNFSVEAKMTKEAHTLYQRACEYEYNNDYDSAILTIQKALEINGDDAMLYTKLAGLYTDTDKYEQALSTYKKALKLRPNDAFIYISIGNILQSTGDYENAYNSFLQAQQIYPEYKYNNFNLANIEYYKKNYKKAIEYYEIFLNTYPEHLEASENLANVYFNDGQPEKACEIFAELYKKYPTAFKNYTQYGIALFDTNQYQAAVEILEKAYKLNSEDEVITARLALAYQNLGLNDKSLEYFGKTFDLNPKLVNLKLDYANLLGNMEQYEQAIEQYKQYISAFPDDADGYRNLGYVYKKMGNDDLALFNFEKSYTKDAANNEVKKELALCYHKKEDYINALKFYDLAIKNEPENIELLANKALALHAMGNYIASIDLYKTILEKYPNERLKNNLVSATVSYGYSLLDKNDYGQAILYFEDAIELNSKDASAYFGYALANEKMCCFDVAKEYYQKAVNLAPNNHEYIKKYESFKETNKDIANEVESENIVQKVINAESLIKDADKLYKGQKYNEALDLYIKAGILNPDDKIILMKIANTYKILGNYDKAVKFYDKLIELKVENPEIYFNKGLCYINQNKYYEAIPLLDKVIQMSPDYPYAYYSLGLAYEHIEKYDKALEFYYLYSGLEIDEKILNIVNERIKKLEKF